MAYEVVFTETFESEYDSILGYHVHHLHAPRAASDLMLSVDRAIDLLTATPQINAISRKGALRNLALREQPVRNYMIVYRIEGNRVVFEHMYHQRQDYARML